MINFHTPWIVSHGFFYENAGSIATDIWKRVTNDIFILEKRLSVGHFIKFKLICGELSDLIYRPVYYVDEANAYEDEPNELSTGPHSYWLNLDNIPAGERSRWGTYPDDMNLKEAETIMEAIELYRWDYGKNQYLLRDMRWSTDEEPTDGDAPT